MKYFLPAIAVLALSGCGGEQYAEDPAGTALCTVPIDIKEGDYTVDYMGEYLYLPDTGDTVKVLYPCKGDET